MSTVCSYCGGTDIEYDQARGDAVCTSCGSVLEDNIIVSEVTFAEQSTGASSVIGQFVSSEGSKIPLSGSGFHHGMGKVSREITLGQAKKRLSHLGNLLKLNQHCIESAFMFFKMALQLNLTRGRKSSIIDTACLYLVCRSEGTPHLLLDFSDVLQINVYALGRAYLRLANALRINPPAIDPCLYIHRFAHKLEFGEKTHEVSMTALRLVARMKRDWIHHGRRPAGLCGAALLVASRIHNFNRSVKEIARVVKLSDGTIRKRLGDFKDTPSSTLTIDEFLKIDLEQEHDPPSFNVAKKRGKEKLGEKDEDLDSSENENDTESSDNEDRENTGLEKEQEEKEIGGYSGIKTVSVQEIIAKAKFTQSYMSSASTAGLSDNLDELAKLVDEDKEGEGEELDDDKMGELEIGDIDDKEIEEMLLSEEEVKIKTQLWFAENGDFLKERELRREKLASIKAEKEKQKKSRPFKPRRTKAHQQTYSNAGEAIEKMLVERKISTKINYDVLRDLAKDIGSEGREDVASGSTLSTAPAGVSSSRGGVATSSSLDSSLAITKMPVGSRLRSLGTRKRTFSSLGGTMASSSLSGSRFSRNNADGSEKVTGTVQIGNSTDTLLKDHQTFSSKRKIDEVDSTETDDMNQVLNKRLRSLEQDHAHNQVTRTEMGESLSGGVTDLSDHLTDGGSHDHLADHEVVEESGPVQYANGEGEGEGGEEGGLDDDEMEELAYEDDPLLHSDYEDEHELDDYGTSY